MRSWLRTTSRGVVAVAAALTVVSGALVSIRGLLPRPTDHSVHITEPGRGAPIPRCVTVAGTGRPAKGHHLWIAVHIEGSFYLLRPVRQDSNEDSGHWSTDSVTIGPAEGVSSSCLITVVDISPATHTALLRLTVDGQDDSLWRLGFPVLPEGASVAAEKHVERNGEDRESCAP
jgi:hypothetical protein